MLTYSEWIENNGQWFARSAFDAANKKYLVMPLSECKSRRHIQQDKMSFKKAKNKLKQTNKQANKQLEKKQNWKDRENIILSAFSLLTTINFLVFSDFLNHSLFFKFS